MMKIVSLPRATRGLCGEAYSFTAPVIADT